MRLTVPIVNKPRMWLHREVNRGNELLPSYSLKFIKKVILSWAYKYSLKMAKNDNCEISLDTQIHSKDQDAESGISKEHRGNDKTVRLKTVALKYFFCRINEQSCRIKPICWRSRRPCKEQTDTGRTIGNVSNTCHCQYWSGCIFSFLVWKFFPPNQHGWYLHGR